MDLNLSIYQDHSRGHDISGVYIPIWNLGRIPYKRNGEKPLFNFHVSYCDDNPIQSLEDIWRDNDCEKRIRTVMPKLTIGNMSEIVSSKLLAELNSKENDPIKSYEIYSKVVGIIRNFNNLKFEKCAVEFIEHESFFFTFINASLLIHIELYIADNPANQAYYSVYNGKEQFLRGMNTISNIVNIINGA
jgi:hypothetical protein